MAFHQLGFNSQKSILHKYHQDTLSVMKAFENFSFLFLCTKLYYISYEALVVYTVAASSRNIAHLYALFVIRQCAQVDCFTRLVLTVTNGAAGCRMHLKSGSMNRTIKCLRRNRDAMKTNAGIIKI